jgi:hypothetical protein
VSVWRLASGGLRLQAGDGVMVRQIHVIRARRNHIIDALANKPEKHFSL